MIIMGNDFAIRRAEPGDRDALTDLCMRSKRSNGYDDAFMAQCAEELRVRDSWISDDHFWLAETASGNPVGCIRLSIAADGETGEVGTCFVDPDWKGKQVGRRLFGPLLEEARNRGVTRIELDSDPFAEPFYVRMGFVTTGRTPSGSIAGRTLPRMELLLDSKLV
ncbi:GNAT family N-acetyltransferase [uncultured Roseibium sp.]|uniref:GNAT family N-acetyltransferase n=1 Tax=uncultured Roseibium sp. TaxID=1936171 RepID=UPI00260F6C30|nr:GNAT family N-acetyltransferase [uncultured Roseibium sp.]